MKEKTVLKIIVDVIMTILYLFLMFSFGTGAFFHEVAGILTGLLFILHNVLNLDFFKGLLKMFKKGSMKPDKKLLLILDDLLKWSLDFLLIFNIHNISSYICLGLLALHLGLHGKYLFGIFKQMRKKKNKKVLVKIMSRCSAAVFTVFFVYMLAYNAYSKSKTVTTNLPMGEETTAISAYETSTDVKSSSEEIATVTSQIENDNAVKNNQDTEQAEITTKKDKDSTQTTQSTTTTAAVPSLSDFLGKMFCTGCQRHCVLTSPQCSRGAMQAEQAEQDYAEQYGTSN